MVLRVEIPQSNQLDNFSWNNGGSARFKELAQGENNEAKMM